MIHIEILIKFLNIATFPKSHYVNLWYHPKALNIYKANPTDINILNLVPNKIHY